MRYFIILACFISPLVQADSIDRVLFIGDSHSYGPYGAEIDNFLRKKTESVTSIAVCGSSPSTWILSEKNLKETNCGYWKKTNLKDERVNKSSIPSLDSEIKQAKPNLVVVSLGTNFMGSPNGVDAEKKYIKDMISKIKSNHSQCIWLGPPDLGRQQYKTNLNEKVSQLKSIVEQNGCYFIDATTFTTYPNGKTDGIHYGPKDSKIWGSQASSHLEQYFSQQLRKQKVRPVHPSESNQGVH